MSSIQGISLRGYEYAGISRAELDDLTVSFAVRCECAKWYANT